MKGCIENRQILIGTINYGTRGKDGIGVEKIEVNSDNSLTIFYTDGRQETTEPILVDGSATNYETLGNLPMINSIELVGNKTLEELGLDLSNFYNKEEVDDIVENLPIPEVEVDMSNYYTKKETEDLIPDVPTKTSQLTNDSDFTTKKYVDQEVAKAASGGTVDLGNYYTKSETDKEIEDAIANLDIPEADVDLTPYAKTEDLATVATSGSYNDLKDTPDATISVGSEPGGDIWIDTSEGEAIDFADVAFTGSYNSLKDIPDLTIYYSKSEVDGKGYVNAEQVAEMIAEAIPASGEEVRY